MNEFSQNSSKMVSLQRPVSKLVVGHTSFPFCWHLSIGLSDLNTSLLIIIVNWGSTIDAKHHLWRKKSFDCSEIKKVILSFSDRGCTDFKQKNLVWTMSELVIILSQNLDLISFLNERVTNGTVLLRFANVSSKNLNSFLSPWLDFIQFNLHDGNKHHLSDRFKTKGVGGVPRFSFD